MYAFIRGGRTNVQYIILVVILAFIAGGVIFGYQQRVLKQEKQTRQLNLTEDKTADKFIEVGAKKEGVKPIMVEDLIQQGKNIGINDLYRAIYLKVIRNALYLYFEDYQKYPTTLRELLDNMPGKTTHYLNEEKDLRDPVTKEFYEYHLETNGYQICINYDEIGRQCYNPQDLQ